MLGPLKSRKLGPVQILRDFAGGGQAISNVEGMAGQSTVANAEGGDFSGLARSRRMTISIV